MATTNAKRLSRGRRFLYENEIQSIHEQEEKDRKKTISSLPLAEDFRGSLEKNTSSIDVFGDLCIFSSGVCQIVVTSSNGYQHCGTGFHFGDGWIISTATVLRNREQVNNAIFLFSSSAGDLVFAAHHRRAIIHRLLPAGRRPDYHNRDFTLVKLGLQHDPDRRIRRKDLEEWEEEEHKTLRKGDLYDFSVLLKPCLSPGAVLEPKRGDSLIAIHFGGTDTEVKKYSVGLTVQNVYKMANNRVVDISAAMDNGASGCPVLQHKSGEWLLLGVYFAGTAFEKNSALQSGQVSHLLYFPLDLKRRLINCVKSYTTSRFGIELELIYTTSIGLLPKCLFSPNI